VSDARDAFEREMLPHSPVVYSTARRLVRQDTDARDLVQETFLRAFRAFGGYTPGTNARAWLLTILYSVFVNRYRRRQRDPDSISLEEYQTRLRQEVAAPSAPGVRASTAARVEAALAALPEAFRAAVVLVDLQELSYEDAAQVLGCPVGTVRSRLSRARRLLAEALQTFAPRARVDEESEV
jgi:RNA polymerase sigma-70 factor (ECF subfamily)